MTSIASRLAVFLTLAFALFFGMDSARTQGESTSTPEAVQGAIAASPTPPDSRQVLVGAYINDIQQIDFKTNNYSVDLYVWFRWKNPALDPAKTMEFMNRFATGDNVREVTFAEPQRMPDGSLYSIVRYQGYFSTKFELEAFPFDTQYLKVLMEDTISDITEEIFAPDGETSISIDPEITVPGFRIGKPTLQVIEYTYPTNFGDLTKAKDETFSRIVMTIPVARPILSMSLKTFMPILLIVVCASLVFFIRPSYVEARIGLGITALLTLVALQLTSTAALPDVDYVMMLDKIYLLAYVFIIAILTRVAVASWKGKDTAHESVLIRGDRTWLAGLLAAYLVANVIIIWTSLD